MSGYTLRKRPINIYAEATQNIGWIRLQFVVYNNASGCVDRKRQQAQKSQKGILLNADSLMH
jgi:hypothetical protein